MPHAKIGAGLIAFVVGTTVAYAQCAADLSDAQVRDQIIQESIAAYKATGHPCACPYDLARNGSRCRGRSAYSRPAGAMPRCYPQDVSDAMVQEWRRGTHC